MTAMLSISTRNSGRVKPATKTTVTAGGLGRSPQNSRKASKPAWTDWPWTM